MKTNENNYYTKHNATFYTGDMYKFLDAEYEAGDIAPELYHIGHKIKFDENMYNEDVPVFLELMYDIINLMAVHAVNICDYDYDKHPDIDGIYAITFKDDETKFYAIADDCTVLNITHNICYCDLAIIIS